MADKRDKIAVEIDGLRSRIESIQRRDSKLQHVSFTRVLRFLIEIGLKILEDELKDVPDPLPQYESIASLVMHRFDRLSQSSRIPPDRLNALMSGDRPTELEIAYLAIALELPIEFIEGLIHEGNGSPVTA